MKKILIVTALSQELNAIKSEINSIKLKDVKVSYLSVWKWNYNLILNLTNFLNKNKFDFIVNVWVCWYYWFKEDIIQIWRIYNISNSKEIIVPLFFEFAKIESIDCSEKIISSKNFQAESNYVDMESYWFELVTDNFLLPRIIIKVPVDKIWDETINFDCSKAENLLRNKVNYNLLLAKIKEYLDKIVSKEDFLEYVENYNFTFSEKEIFKKLCNRYLSLVSNDIEKYINENQVENKDEFLKNFELYLEKFLIK